jgi:hypothetical protein
MDDKHALFMMRLAAGQGVVNMDLIMPTSVDPQTVIPYEPLSVARSLPGCAS